MSGVDSEVEAERESRGRGGKHAALRADLSAALAAFDRAQDWADLIHDLQRVNRVLVKHDSGSYIPDKVLLAKRLAQCLTSSLPSGVHLKALETYHLVFGKIGAARLARDLPLYSAGPFPLHAYAATSLKGTLLSMYETHYIPLGKALRPICDGFVLALLPGLDDETSEFYERTLSILNQLETAVDDTKIFHSSLWRALIYTPPSRLSAATYLRVKMSEFGTQNVLYSSVIRDSYMVVSGISAALSDDHVLVQRAGLELLVGSFPIVMDLVQPHIGGLVLAALTTLLRKDLSLTKRVHAWLLGNKEGDAGVAFCSHHSRNAILESFSIFSHELEAQVDPPVQLVTKPYKLMSGILDRQELFDCLHHDLSLLAFRFASQGQRESYRREVDHAVSQLVNQIGVKSVAADILNSLCDDSERDRSGLEFRIAGIGFGFLSQMDDLPRKELVMSLVGATVLGMTNRTREATALHEATELLIQLLGAVNSMTTPEGLDEARMQDSLETFAEFALSWVTEHIPSSVDTSIPLEPHGILERDLSTSSKNEEETAAFISAASLLLSGSVPRASPKCNFATARFALVCARSDRFRIVIAGLRTFIEVAPSISQDEELRDYLTQILLRTWNLVHPSLSTSSVQVVELWQRLQARYPGESSAVISDGILSSSKSSRLKCMERFAFLWRTISEHHLGTFPSDRGIYLMLDSLSGEDPSQRLLAEAWLSYSLRASPAHVFDAPLRLLFTAETLTIGENGAYQTLYDVPRTRYGLALIRRIVATISRLRDIKGDSIALESARVSTETTSLIAKLFAGQGTSETDLSGLLPADSYVLALLITALGFLRGTVDKDQSSSSLWLAVGLGINSLEDLHRVVSADAAELVTAVIDSLQIGSEFSSRVAKCTLPPVLNLLNRAIRNHDAEFQIRLLDIAEGLIRLEGVSFPEHHTGHWGEPIQTFPHPLAVEDSPMFLQTLLLGLPVAVTVDRVQELMNLRSRWVLYAATCVSHARISLPAVSEGVISLLCRLLLSDFPGEREFSRINGRLSLLKGLSVMTQRVLDLYEVAVSSGMDLDGNAQTVSLAQSSELFSTNGSMSSTRQQRQSNSTSNMIAAPLRFFNDLVKDVFIGSSGEPKQTRVDPRKAAAVSLFSLMPKIVAASVKAWGKPKKPIADSVVDLNEEEMRSAQRQAVLGLLEPLVLRYPVDLFGSFVVVWNEQRIAHDGIDFVLDPESLDRTRLAILDILQMMTSASPVVVTQALGSLLDAAIHWDDSSAAAIAGRSRRKKKQQKGDERMKHRPEIESAGEANGQVESDPSEEGDRIDSPAVTDATPRGLFNAADYFADCTAAVTEISTLSLLQAYYRGSEHDEEDLVAAWVPLFNISRDLVSSVTRPFSQLLVLNTLAAFSRGPRGHPLADKRLRRDFAGIAAQVVSVCCLIAGSNVPAPSASVSVELGRIASRGLLDLPGAPTPIDRVAFVRCRAVCSMRNSIATLLHQGFEDDRPAAVNPLSQCVTQLLSTLKRRAERSPDETPASLLLDERAAMAAAEVVFEFTELAWSLKLIYKEILALLEDAGFFRGKGLLLLRSLGRCVNAAMTYDKTNISLVGGVPTSQGPVGGGFTAVFAGRESEVALRARAIRRVAFCFFVGGKTSYTAQIPSALERLRDSLRTGSRALTVDCLLCLRVLLVRAGANSIAPFRATTLAELSRILLTPFADLEETMAALRFLDLLCLFRPPEFAFDRCFFLGDQDIAGQNGTSSMDSDALESVRAFDPLVNLLASEPAVNADEEMKRLTFRAEPNRTVAGGSFTIRDRTTAILYARKLLERNAMEGPNSPDLETVEKEIEEEFVEDAMDSAALVLARSSRPFEPPTTVQSMNS